MTKWERPPDAHLNRRQRQSRKQAQERQKRWDAEQLETNERAKMLRDLGFHVERLENRLSLSGPRD
jgi:hypothetical protein